MSVFHIFKFFALNFQIITEYGEQILEETKKSKQSTPRKKGKKAFCLIVFCELHHGIWRFPG